jgi:microcystin-dependent protein
MSTPFIGEIRAVSFNFPPRGWAFCNGQLLAINTNQALFSLLGTTYGGNGQTTFALPSLQARHAMHTGGSFPLGAAGGQSAHTLTISELPTHTHLPAAATSPDNPGTDPTGAVWAARPTVGYATTPNQPMNPAALGGTGGSQPHENAAPYLVLNYVIALQGIFPSQN